LWLNVAMSTRQTLISKGYLHEFELTLDPDGELLLYQGNGSTYSSVAGPAGAITQNVWHHLVVTRDGATNTVRFYVDGAARGSGTSAISATAGTNLLTIGRSSAGGNFVSGYMQDAAVYGTVLTPAQVLEHWALRAADGNGT